MSVIEHDLEIIIQGFIENLGYQDTKNVLTAFTNRKENVVYMYFGNSGLKILKRIVDRNASMDNDPVWVERKVKWEQ